MALWKSCLLFLLKSQQRGRSVWDAGDRELCFPYFRSRPVKTWQATCGAPYCSISYSSNIHLSVCSCRRPLPVCICSCFPSEPLPIQTRVIILQHPHEVSNRLPDMTPCYLPLYYSGESFPSNCSTPTRVLAQGQVSCPEREEVCLY